MPPIDAPVADPGKLMLIGKSGAGKTGSLASLVAGGYKLRILDTDKGVKTLRSLLLDDRYPYAKILAKQGIKPGEAVHYIPIDTSMGLRTTTRKVGDKTFMERLLAPKDAKAWERVIEVLEHWKDGDVDYGPVTSWDESTVLVLDSFSTLAKNAYYLSQMLNGRLGARDEGRTYQQDIGAAQAQLTRLLEMIYDSSIRCNVIVISHITWVDDSSGNPNRPRDATGDGNNFIPANPPDGYPAAIGRALSPQMGKYFNDVYSVRVSGSGSSVQREILTVPTDGISSKKSVWLANSYPISTGLLQIFSAQRNIPEPKEIIDAIRNSGGREAGSPAASIFDNIVR